MKEKYIFNKHKKVKKNNNNFQKHTAFPTLNLNDFLNAKQL